MSRRTLIPLLDPLEIRKILYHLKELVVVIYYLLLDLVMVQIHRVLVLLQYLLGKLHLSLDPLLQQLPPNMLKQAIGEVMEANVILILRI
ncbi:hypothetical protein O3M35_005671 [Rhynocoris fuscipes]|uniref:Uncharacterized protein n=1 Tax=Rhynocoris fuscipes TaxID=488301 RepID=A0AAW1DJU3_9HEMI